MVSFPYRSHIFRDSYGNGMGVVWEAYHNEVPLLGVPENPVDYMGVSKYRGKPTKSSILILIGFSIINHPFWGTTILGNTHICIICLLGLGPGMSGYHICAPSELFVLCLSSKHLGGKNNQRKHPKFWCQVMMSMWQTFVCENLFLPNCQPRLWTSSSMGFFLLVTSGKLHRTAYKTIYVVITNYFGCAANLNSYVPCHLLQETD